METNTTTVPSVCLGVGSRMIDPLQSLGPSRADSLEHKSASSIAGRQGDPTSDSPPLIGRRLRLGSQRTQSSLCRKVRRFEGDA